MKKEKIIVGFDIGCISKFMKKAKRIRFVSFDGDYKKFRGCKCIMLQAEGRDMNVDYADNVLSKFFGKIAEYNPATDITWSMIRNPEVKSPRIIAMAIY